MSRTQRFALLSVFLVIFGGLDANTATLSGNDIFSVRHLPANCNEAIHLAGSKAKSGIGEAWTLIQLRKDEYMNFYRGWKEYKNGFGNLNRNFFIGLDKLHALTASQLHELWIELKDFDNVTKYAKYDSFAIADESQKYALSILGKYSGTAVEAMLGVNDGAKFSTHDQDNSERDFNCAAKYKGGWWYGKRICHKSNLNGLYLKGITKSFADGIVWEPWHGYHYSLKYAHIAIRPKDLLIRNVLVN